VEDYRLPIYPALTGLLQSERGLHWCLFRGKRKKLNKAERDLRAHGRANVFKGDQILGEETGLFLIHKDYEHPCKREKNFPTTKEFIYHEKPKPFC
jgi:hypothetical protein